MIIFDLSVAFAIFVILLFIFMEKNDPYSVRVIKLDDGFVHPSSLLDAQYVNHIHVVEEDGGWALQVDKRFKKFTLPNGFVTVPPHVSVPVPVTSARTELA